MVSLIGAIKRNQQHAPSKLPIPLSYAAILGTLTIGTSTNLIINSFVEDAGFQVWGSLTYIDRFICTVWRHVDPDPFELFTA